MSRSDVTALVGALRAGVSASGLLRAAPGLSAAGLRAAYDHLESARARCEEAWRDRLSERPRKPLDLGILRQLLPSPAHRLAQHAAAEASTDGYLVRLSNAIAELRARSDDVMATIGAVADPATSVQLGRRLYDPYLRGLWNASVFLPRRVGELDPPRVALLLGER